MAGHCMMVVVVIKVCELHFSSKVSGSVELFESWSERLRAWKRPSRLCNH